MQCQLFNYWYVHIYKSFKLIGLLTPTDNTYNPNRVNNWELTRLITGPLTLLTPKTNRSFNWALIQFDISLNKQDSKRGLNI